MLIHIYIHIIIHVKHVQLQPQIIVLVEKFTNCKCMVKYMREVCRTLCNPYSVVGYTSLHVYSIRILSRDCDHGGSLIQSFQCTQVYYWTTCKLWSHVECCVVCANSCRWLGETDRELMMEYVYMHEVCV